MKAFLHFLFTICFSLSVLLAVSQRDCGTSINNYGFSLNDAAYLNDSTIILVGNYGVILKSYDYGSSWKRINSGTIDNLRNVQFLDEQVGYILGGWSDRLLKTEDSGETWFNLSINNEYPYCKNLFFLSADTGFLVGDDGKIFRTLNGGRSFERQSPYQTSNDLTAAFFVNDSVGFVCGKSGTVLKTVDLGESWYPAIEANPLIFMDIWFTDENTGFLLSRDGQVIKTDDCGESWVLISDLSTDYATRIYFTDGLIGYVIGGWTGTDFYKTSDAGMTWNSVSPISGGSLSGIAMDRNGENGIVVGDAAGYSSTAESGRLMLKSSNFGENWIVDCMLEGDNNYYDIQMVDEGIGYLVGGRYMDDGRIYKTDNEGITWEKLPFSPTKNIKECEFVDRDFGLIAADSVYLTKDGGSVWETIPQFAGPNFKGDKLCFLNRDTGFYSRNGDIYKTVDGCHTWDTVHDGQDLLHDIEFANNMVGFATGFLQTLKTTDGGETWEYIDALSEILLFKTIFAFNADTVLLGGLDGILYKTTDGGSTWTEIDSGITLDIVDLDFFENDYGVAITNNDGGTGHVYCSFDYGDTWQFEIKVFDDIYHNSFTSEGKAFFVGDRGILMKEEDNLPPLLPSYIIGDTVVLRDSVYNYSLCAPTGANNIWEVTGTGMLQDFYDSIMVSWPDTGSYVIKLMAENDCGSSPERMLNVRVLDSLAYGVDDDFYKMELSIYPNPVGNILHVNISSDELYDASIKVFDYLGRQVKTSFIEKRQTQIEVAELKSGIYFIELTKGNLRYIRKIIKH